MPVRFLCLDEGSDFVHDLVEQINRHSEVDGEGLPVGIKAGDVGLSSPLLLCEPRPNPPTSAGLLGLAAGRLAVLLLLLRVQGYCSLPPVDLDHHEEQDQDESFF